MIFRLIAPITLSSYGEALDGVVEMTSEIGAALNGIDLHVLGHPVNVAATIRDSGQAIDGVPADWSEIRPHFGYTFLELSVDLASQWDRPFEYLGHSVSGREAPRVLLRSVSEAIYAALANEVLASNIADPGLVNMESPFAIFDGELLDRHPQMSWVLREAVEIAATTKWPELRRLPFATVSAWLGELPGFGDGVGTGRVGRAVAALSYILHGSATERSHVDLAWALLGLEALYASGKDGLARQLSEKSELVLGPRSEHKKIVSRMYDYRSRFLHGGLDLPIAYREFHFDGPQHEVTAEAYDCWRLGSAMLVATLQELVVRGLSDMEFEYRLK